MIELVMIFGLRCLWGYCEGRALVEGTIVVNSFLACTIGILVFFVGMRVNSSVPILWAYNIPEPVTGGMLAAFVGLGVVDFIFFVLFPLMGRDHLAVVLCAGVAGVALGATPTAVANMTVATKTHGPAPTAFIILPLVGVFFADLTNAFVIQGFLAL